MSVVLHVMYIHRCVCACVRACLRGCVYYVQWNLSILLHKTIRLIIISSFIIFIILPKQVHPKTKIEDQDELSSLLQVPIVVCTCVTCVYNCGLVYLRVCKCAQPLLCLCTYLTADVHTLGNGDLVQYTPPLTSCIW